MGTFGNTGGASATNWGPNEVDVSSATLSEDGFVTSLSVKLNSQGKTAGDVTLAIYADSSGTPGSLLVTSQQIAIASGLASQFFKANLASPYELAAGTYWLGVIGNELFSLLLDSGGSRKASSATYPTLPNPFGTPGASLAQTIAVYATYDATPVNSVAPTVSGSSVSGSTLTATTGTWTNSPTYGYQWTRAGANIVGATSSTYLTQAADVGHAIGCTVTATNGTASASQASSNTITVLSAPNDSPGHGHFAAYFVTINP
jgi:hypothetical protein